MESDYQSGHGLPTDFPTDPSFGGFYVVGGLSSLLLLAIIAGVLLGFITGMRDKRRDNYEDWPRRMAKFIRRKTNEAIRGKDDETAGAMRPFWQSGRDDNPRRGQGPFAWLFGSEPEPEDKGRKNVRDINEQKARQATLYVRELLGGSLKLGKEINAEVKHLSEALDGFKEIKDAAPGFGGPMNGGAIINIAVNQGVNAADPVQVIGGPYAPGSPGTPVHAAQLQPAVVVDHDASVWLAFNKFREEWDNVEVSAGIIGAAQSQLCAPRAPEPPPV